MGTNTCNKPTPPFKVAIAIRDHPHLTSPEKLVLHSLLTRVDWKTLKARVSIAQLAQDSGLSTRTVQRAFNGNPPSLGLLHGFTFLRRERAYDDGEESVSYYVINYPALAAGRPRMTTPQQETERAPIRLPDHLTEQIRIGAELSALDAIPGADDYSEKMRRERTQKTIQRTHARAAELALGG